jgi:hypothetical protein
VNDFLSEKFQASLEAHRKSWLETTLSTAELDPVAVWDAFKTLYEDAQMPLPQYVIWLQSPLAGAVAAAILAQNHENIYKRVFNQPTFMMGQKLWKEAVLSGSDDSWKVIANELKSPIGTEVSLTIPVRTQVSLQLSAVFGLTNVPTSQNQQTFSTEVWEGIVEYLGPQLRDVDAQILQTTRFNDKFAGAAANQTWYCGLGSLDGETLQLFDFADPDWFDLPDIRGLIKAARHCGWWWAFDDAIIVTSRPSCIILDNEGKLHCDTGPAIEYPDGWGVLSRHGQYVPERVISFSHGKSLELIEREQNAEVRRHLIDIYGIEKFLKDSEAVKIAEDSSGALYRKDMIGDEPLLFVRVKNSTPEADGTYKFYFLRVPPHVTSAREAVAWTFAMELHEYNPEVET